MLRLALALALLAAPAQAETCRASWYARGRVTASGEPYRPMGMTAAHRSLPFHTRLLVSFHGRSVVVRVTDRGPAAWTGRCLDLSAGAARALGLVQVGVGLVTIEPLL